MSDVNVFFDALFNFTISTYLRAHSLDSPREICIKNAYITVIHWTIIKYSCLPLISRYCAQCGTCNRKSGMEKGNSNTV